MSKKVSVLVIMGLVLLAVLLASLLNFLTIWMLTVNYGLDEVECDWFMCKGKSTIQVVNSTCYTKNLPVNCSELLKEMPLADGFVKAQTAIPKASLSFQGLAELLHSFALSHSYDYYSYTCVDYATDASRMLRENGYMASYVQGQCPNLSNSVEHAWVEVVLWVEPQTGQIIGPDECYSTDTMIWKLKA